MVFGSKNHDWTVWRKHYAWRPVKLIDGRRAWLERVEITGYVENPSIGLYVRFNVRIFGTSFCARLPAA